MNRDETKRLGDIRLSYRHFERNPRIFFVRGQGLTPSPHVPRTSPLSSSVFHTDCALSAPTGHLPLEGKAGDTRETCHRKPSGIIPYIFAAKPPPSFLIPHSNEPFKPNQGRACPTGSPFSCCVIIKPYERVSLRTCKTCIRETLIKSQNSISHVFSCNASS